MTLRVCSVPGCPNLQAESKCKTHRAAAERKRGTRQQRGYDQQHQDLRAHYQRRMAAGEAFICWRPDCDKPIDPTNWHLGHDDHDRSVYRGPECVSCNTATSGR